VPTGSTWRAPGRWKWATRPTETVKGILAVGADTAPAAATGGGSASMVTPAHLHGPGQLLAHLDSAKPESPAVGA